MKIKKGMTLIEVLVSSIILAMVIGSILASYVAYQRTILRNKVRQEAITIIDNNFEQINAAVNNGVNSITLLQAKLPEFDTVNGHFISSDHVSYNLTHTSAPLIIINKEQKLEFAPELLNVTAKLTWNYLGRNEEITMQYLTKAEKRD